MTTLSPILGLTLGGLLLVSGVAVGFSALAGDGDRKLQKRLRFIKDGFVDDEDDAALGFAGQVLKTVDTISQAVGSLAIAGEKQRGALRQILWQAGIRRPDAVRLLLTIKLLGMIACGLLLPAVAVTAGLLVFDPLRLVLAAITGALIGGYLPEYIVKSRASARRRRIQRRLPDALDLLIIFANAGYGLDMAIQRLALDLARSAPDLSDELAYTSDQLRLSSERDRVLSELAARTGLESVRTLVTTLTQSQKYGTPLSQALRVLANEQRNKGIVEMEERAAKMPVLMTVPLILLILPAVIIIAGTPAFIQMGKVWNSAIETPSSSR